MRSESFPRQLSGRAVLAAVVAALMVGACTHSAPPPARPEKLGVPLQSLLARSSDSGQRFDVVILLNDTTGLLVHFPALRVSSAHTATAVLTAEEIGRLSGLAQVVSIDQAKNFIPLH